MATEEDIDLFADHCAICWDTLEQARKLPCGHLFHQYVFFLYQGCFYFSE